MAALSELWVALLGWIPTPVGVLIRLICWKPLFESLGSVRFATGVFLAGSRNMRLGAGCRIGRGCILTAQDGKLEMGERAALSPGVHVSADGGEIRIGSCVAIGPGCVLRAANHRFDRLDVPIMDQGHRPGTISIDRDVWLGANCVVTPDVRIGEGAVIGAGAVVTHDIAPYAIAAGVPARVIGSRQDKAGAASGSKEAGAWR